MPPVLDRPGYPPGFFDQADIGGSSGIYVCCALPSFYMPYFFEV